VVAQTHHQTRHDAEAIEAVLNELLSLQRELAELEYVRRTDALERVADGIRRLAEVGSTEGIVARAAAELGGCSEFGRVLISEVIERRLHPIAIWDRSDQAGADQALAGLQAAPIALEYPLIEAEVLRGSGAAVLDAERAPAGGAGPLARGAGPLARGAGPLARALGWPAYVVVALTVQGEPIGLLHAGAPAGPRPLDQVDAEVAAKYAAGLAGVFERAVLRHTLELHRAELQSAAQWMGGRLSRLSELATPTAGRPDAGAALRLVESLTPRELEVLRLLTRGHTNLAIANTLVVREGTVKYHVKNILRKLEARSRTEAVSRFVRSSWPEATG